MIIGFRTIAPTCVGFFLAPGSAERDPEAYRSFWQRAAQEYAGDRWSILHSGADTSGSVRYRSIRDDDLERPLHSIQGHWNPSELPIDLPQGLDRICDSVMEIDARLYDHGILMVEASGSFELDDVSPARLDEIQDALVDVTTEAAATICRVWLRELLASLAQLDPKSEFVEIDVRDNDAAPKWVARGLILPESSYSAPIARHWLMDASVPEEVEAWIGHEEDHVVRWLNYVFSNDPASDGVTVTREGEDAWRGLRYAQYFYAALDEVDDQLNVVLAQTVRGRKRWEVAELKYQLQQLSHRAEVVMNDLYDLRKYVTRAVRREMDAILDVWDFDALLGDPVRFKISSCDRRLQEMSASEQARANTITDMILLVIGVTSVLATALSLTQFGRQVGTDPSQAAYGPSSSGITEWLASQPVDAIVLSSLAISVLFVVLFFAVRSSENT